MGLGVNRGGNRTFINMFNGSMVIKATSDTPGAISRINKKNEKVWELRFNSLKGILNGITKKETDYGPIFEISILDDKEYVLNIPVYGGQSFKLFTKLVTVKDFSRPIEISCSEKDEKTQFFVSQDGTHMKAYWTKDNKRGLPDLVEGFAKGKKTWDDTAQMTYIEDVLNKHICPKLKNLGFDAGPDGPTDDPDEAEAHQNFQNTAQNTAPPQQTVKEEDLPDWAKEPAPSKEKPPAGNTKKGGQQAPAPASNATNGLPF